MNVKKWFWSKPKNKKNAENALTAAHKKEQLKISFQYFYETIFGIKPDFSDLVIPDYDEEAGDYPLIVAKGLLSNSIIKSAHIKMYKADYVRLRLWIQCFKYSIPSEKKIARSSVVIGSKRSTKDNYVVIIKHYRDKSLIYKDCHSFEQFLKTDVLGLTLIEGLLFIISKGFFQEDFSFLKEFRFKEVFLFGSRADRIYIPRIKTHQYKKNSGETIPILTIDYQLIKDDGEEGDNPLGCVSNSVAKIGTKKFNFFYIQKEPVSN